MQDDPQTCGKGLAAHAALPEDIGALMAAMAGLLHNHTRSLDPGNAEARTEREAYARLVEQQQSIAASLRALAATMRGYHDLPMAPHDESTLADQASLDVFASYVAAEESVLALLQESVAEHRAMLTAMGGR
jgi:hypothetical protein